MRAQSVNNPLLRRESVSPGDLAKQSDADDWIVEPPPTASQADRDSFDASWAVADTIKAYRFGDPLKRCSFLAGRWEMLSGSGMDAYLSHFKTAALNWLDATAEDYIDRQYPLKRLQDLRDLWGSASYGSPLYVAMAPLMATDAQAPGYLAAQFFETVVCAGLINSATTVAAVDQAAADIVSASEPGAGRPNFARHEPPPVVTVSHLSTLSKTI